MGIRFLCHHCEKRLNVKVAQAGTEGQCPQCDGIILVPLESTIPSELEKKRHKDRNRKRSQALKEDRSIGLHPIDEQITADGIPAEKRQNGNPIKAGAAETSRFKPDTVKTFESPDESAELFMLDKPKPASLGKVDPIAESPDSVWYFRSHELGERGPLKGKVMREHVDKGDVTVGCVVWRQDWDDWIPAEEVFPSLVALVKNNRKKQRVAKAYRDANIPQPSSTAHKKSLFAGVHKNQKIFYAAIAVGIVLICVLLFVVAKVIASDA